MPTNETPYERLCRLYAPGADQTWRNQYNWREDEAPEHEEDEMPTTTTTFHVEFTDADGDTCAVFQPGKSAAQALGAVRDAYGHLADCGVLRVVGQFWPFDKAWEEAHWAQAQGMHYCPNCRAYFDVVRRARAEHLCTVWDGPVCTTPGCNEPTVFVTVAAPGTGKGYSCRAGHFDGYSRVLEPWEVV